MKKLGGLFFAIHIILAAYFINVALELVTIPEFIENIGKWLIFSGGILLVLAGLHHLRPSRRRPREKRSRD